MSEPTIIEPTEHFIEPPSFTEPPSFIGLIQSALDTALSPEMVQAKVNTQVENIVDGVIKEALCTWSGAGKDIKEAVSKSLEVGDGLNIPSYGAVVCQLLEAQIQARVADVVGRKLQEDMEKLLTLAPKEVKLSDLIANLLEDEEHIDGVSLTVEWSEYSHVWVYLTEGPGNKANLHNHDISLMMRLPKKADDHGRDEQIKGIISSGSVKGTDLGKDITFGYGTDYKKEARKFGSWFGLEQKILSMYAVGTVIELDEDDCILSKYDY